MKRIGTFLIAVALVAGMVGCGNGNGEVSYQLTVSSTAGGSVVEPGEGVHSYEEGTVVDLVAEPDTGHRFVNWTGDVVTVADIDSNVTIITINEDCTITANFEEIPVYYLTVSSTEGGSATSPGEGTFAYEQEMVVGLAASPSVGYVFDKWTGDVGTVHQAGSAVTTVTMDGDYTITAVFEEDEVVTFVDAELEAAVRESIGITERPLYARDMELLTSLNAAGRAISDLTGLEYATSMVGLNLGNNQIGDLSPLANLTDLKELNLADNQISDISRLSGLTKLTELWLMDNQISDISPLANINGLRDLHCWGNQISDISPLANIAWLNGANLGYNHISDISPLADVRILYWLDLRGNEIVDVSALAHRQSLTFLRLSDNQIRDISPLAGC